MTLKDMVEFAWNVQPFQISGGPSWLDSIRYDVVAKPESKASQGEFYEMLQTLLTDRFQLRIHRETKELPIYALVLARRDGKPGPDPVQSTEGSCQKFDPSNPPQPPQPGVAPPRFCGTMRWSPISLECRARESAMSRDTAVEIAGVDQIWPSRMRLPFFASAARER